jgi:Family of unknown function (DUF6492)
MTAIDIVIPAHEKDFAVLRHAVRGILRHVRPIGCIYVVARQRFEWHGGPVEWVPEPLGSGLPSLKEVRARWSTRGSDVSRGSWVYQQILKLGAGAYIDGLSPSYLVIDSDVIFLRTVSFATEDGTRFPYSCAFEYHEPYREAYRRLLGEAPSIAPSLTAHHMLYDRALLSELMTEIEQRHGKTWPEAYLDAVDYEQDSSISEMDVYGWWVLDRHPEMATRRQLVWRDTHVVPGILGRAMLARDCHFVAAHAWMRQPRWRRFGALAVHMTREFRADLARRRAPGGSPA